PPTDSSPIPYTTLFRSVRVGKTTKAVLRSPEARYRVITGGEHQIRVEIRRQHWGTVSPLGPEISWPQPRNSNGSSARNFVARRQDRKSTRLNSSHVANS